MKHKTAIVFGCYGQDGALISKSLLAKNYTVIGISRKGLSHSRKLSKLGINDQIHIEKGDIKNINFIENVIKKYEPDELCNLAAQSSVGKSFDNPINTFESIVNATINILQASKSLKYQGSIFFAGSSEIYGNTNEGATINHVQDPKSPYGIAKQASFKLVKLFREVHHLKCMTGVLFNHESAFRDKHFVTQKIISGAIKSSKDKKHKIELGNINIARDWGWAEEYVEAMQIIARSKEIKDQVICTGKLTTLEEFINIAYNQFDLRWQDHVIINNSLKRKNDVLKSFGNPDPLKDELNWQATTDIEKFCQSLLSRSTRYILCWPWSTSRSEFLLSNRSDDGNKNKVARSYLCMLQYPKIRHLMQ